MLTDFSPRGTAGEQLSQTYSQLPAPLRGLKPSSSLTFSQAQLWSYPERGTGAGGKGSKPSCAHGRTWQP